MSQNREHVPSEGQSPASQSVGEPSRKNYESFEGMNFEQRRQPFHLHPAKDQRRDNENQRHEES